MAIEKNPNEITKPVDIAQEKIQAQSEQFGVDVNIKEEQEEDIVVNVDETTGEAEIALNEDSG